MPQPESGMNLAITPYETHQHIDVARGYGLDGLLPAAIGVFGNELKPEDTACTKRVLAIVPHEPRELLLRGGRLSADGIILEVGLEQLDLAPESHQRLNTAVLVESRVLTLATDYGIIFSDSESQGKFYYIVSSNFRENLRTEETREGALRHYLKMNTDKNKLLSFIRSLETWTKSRIRQIEAEQSTEIGTKVHSLFTAHVIMDQLLVDLENGR